MNICPTGRSILTLGYLLASVFLPASLARAAEKPPLAVPFHERFKKPPAQSGWKVDVSPGNSIAVGGGVLKVKALDSTYAHIERPLGVDRVRVTCTLKSRGGVSWTSSLFLYWDTKNYCQISVLDHNPNQPNHYVAELIDGTSQEHRFPFPAAAVAEWYHVAIELAEDSVRYKVSQDGKSWTEVRTFLRPDPWKGKAPTLLIVGKGYSAPPRYAAPDLDNDYPTGAGWNLPPRTVSLVREVSVVRLPESQIRLSEQEKKRFRSPAELGRDELGEEELAAPGDPSFESVSRHYPPMKHPREVLGVKDGPQEILVLPDGTLGFADKKARFTVGAKSSPGAAGCVKRLLEGYLPIVVAQWESDGLKCEQTALGWSPQMSPDTPLAGLVHLKVANPAAQPRKVEVKFAVDTPALTWTLDLPAKGEHGVYVKIPFDQPATASKIEAAEFDQRLSEVATYWKVLVTKGMKVHTPEQLVNDAYRAWLAWNFIDVDKRGEVYEPHDGGGGFYEAVFGYSASRYCYALDLWGYPAEARQYLDSILSFVDPEGLLVVNYGLPDTGAQLWAMCRHYQMTGDADWLRKVAPTTLKMCNWIIAARKFNMSQQAKDDLWYGLIKYRPYCDEVKAANSYHTDTYLLLGLEETAAALRGIGMTDEADRLAAEAEAYRQDILRSMDKAVITRRGMKMLPMFPETRALLERAGYTGADYYSLISCMVLETDVLPPDDRRFRLITDLLEQKNGLSLGVCAFRWPGASESGIDHAYTYGYWMNCLQRDEVKRVILGFYTSLAYGMSRDTYAGVETTIMSTGENAATLPHLYSGTHQLLLLRNMLLRECGDTLMLGQAIPRAWLEDGKEVRVEDAPTLFGDVGYSIKSHNGARKMTVRVDPPTKHPPKAIHVRLRHPAGKPIQAVMVDGLESKDFTADTVILTKIEKPAVVDVRF